MIVRERGVDVGKRNLRELSHDFVRRQPLLLMPNDNILDPNAVPGDSRLAATDSRRRFDMLSDNHFDHDFTCNRETRSTV